MLTSRKYVNNRNLGCHYIITNMDDDTLREVKSKFSVYQSKGVILNDSFNDNIWRLTNQISTFSIKFIVEKNLYQKNTEEWSGCSYQCFVEAKRKDTSKVKKPTITVFTKEKKMYDMKQ